MRTRKYRIVTRLESINNRLTRLALRRGLSPKAFALLETTGRRSGRLRHTPIGNGLIGDTFWLVAAHGEQADYVRNLLAHPQVRVKICGRWRSGTAQVGEPDCRAERRCGVGGEFVVAQVLDQPGEQFLPVRERVPQIPADRDRDHLGWSRNPGES